MLEVVNTKNAIISMPLVKTTFPSIVVRNVIDEIRRWTKHSSQNFALLNDNLAVVTFDATHATEVPIKNPFGERGAPVGMRIVDSTGLPVASSSMRVARLIEDNRIGVTAQFAAPPTITRVSKTSDQTGIASGTSTAVTWGIIDYGDDIVDGATGVFTFPYSGIVHGFATLGATANGVAAGDSWGAFLSESLGAGTRRLEGRIGVPTQSRPILNISGEFAVAAGDQLLYTFIQHNAAAAAKDLESGNVLAGCHAGFHYVAPALDSSATITAVLYGPGCNIVDVNG